MATFRPRKTKHGVVYDIQVKVKDFSTQKTIIKTTTWRPKEKMTPKQEERACAKFADEFEQTMLNFYSSSRIEIINPNINVCDYAKIWLERVHKDFSLSYYEMSMNSVNIIQLLRSEEITPLKYGDAWLINTDELYGFLSGSIPQNFNYTPLIKRDLMTSGEIYRTFLYCDPGTKIRKLNIRLFVKEQDIWYFISPSRKRYIDFNSFMEKSTRAT